MANKTRLGHFPPSIQTGRLAGPVFNVFVPPSRYNAFPEKSREEFNHIPLSPTQFQVHSFLNDKTTSSKFVCFSPLLLGSRLQFTINIKAGPIVGGYKQLLWKQNSAHAEIVARFWPWLFFISNVIRDGGTRLNSIFLFWMNSYRQRL